MSENSKPKVLNNNSSIREWLQKATHLLRKAGIESARLDAELLLSEILNVDRTWLIAHDTENIPSDTAESALKRRQKREPLAYIRGWQEFYGRRFVVTPDTLIPRPESERIIDLLRTLPIERLKVVFDVGTGSGCLGITTALEFPDSTITLIDTSSTALQVAQQNASALLSAHRQPQLLQSDLLTEVSETPTTIIANLPYVDVTWERSPETAYEPSLALFASNNGLALIEKLIAQASQRLQPQGFLILEADPRQMDAITRFAKQYQLTMVAQEAFVIVLQH